MTTIWCDSNALAMTRHFKQEDSEKQKQPKTTKLEEFGKAKASVDQGTNTLKTPPLPLKSAPAPAGEEATAA